MNKKALLLDYTLIHTPHFIIEVNQKCNLSCSACYKKRSSYQKDLKQIKDEIDFGLTKRLPDLITFAGGEPTLNDNLTEAVRYVSAKKINTVILSNGYDVSDTKLFEYKKAGLYMIYYHIDSMQNRPDIDENKDNEIMEKDMNELRDAVFKRTFDKKINCGLCVTLYKSRLNELSDIIKYVLSSVCIKGLLATGYIDIDSLIKKYIVLNDIKRYEDKSFEINDYNIKTDFSIKTLNKFSRPSGGSFPGQTVKNIDIEKIIFNNFGIKPDFYIPSSDNKDRRWIIYFVIVIIHKDKSYKINSLSNNFLKLLNAMNFMHKKLFNRSRFVVKMNVFHCISLCFLSGLLSFNAGKIAGSFIFIMNLFKKGSSIHFKDMVFQQGPDINDKGDLIYCKSCPDAAVRNNKLMPVCLADFIEPPDHL